MLLAGVAVPNDLVLRLAGELRVRYGRERLAKKLEDAHLAGAQQVNLWPDDREELLQALDGAEEPPLVELREMLFRGTMWWSGQGV